MKQQSAITTNKGTNICKQYKWRRQQSSNVTYLFTTVARGAWAPGVARRLRCRSDFPWAPIINTSIPNGFIFNIKRIQYYIAQRDLYIYVLSDMALKMFMTHISPLQALQPTHTCVCLMSDMSIIVMAECVTTLTHYGISCTDQLIY